MWKQAGDALKRFWSGLSGGYYQSGANGPVNFENMQPIPVIQVLEYGADDGDKTPKMYVPKNSTGDTLVHDTITNAVVDSINSLTSTNTYLLNPLAVAAPTTSPSAAIQRVHRIGITSLQSNAGGTLDADVPLVSALAGYYGMMKLKGIWSNGAETPTWVIQGNATIWEPTTPAHTAGQNEEFLNNAYVQGDADNQVIFLDTTSSNLGNVVSYIFFYEYWYET